MLSSCLFSDLFSFRLLQRPITCLQWGRVWFWLLFFLFQLAIPKVSSGNNNNRHHHQYNLYSDFQNYARSALDRCISIYSRLTATTEAHLHRVWSTDTHPTRSWSGQGQSAVCVPKRSVSTLNLVREWEWRRLTGKQLQVYGACPQSFS